MMRFFQVVIAVLLSLPSYGQFTPAQRDSLAQLTRQDHLQMLVQLGITEADLRPGPSGNPNAPNAANADEEQVRHYVLPPLLRFADNTEVSTPQGWWGIKRPEVVELLEREVYGREPQSLPSVQWQTESVVDTTVGNFPVTQKLLKGWVDNSDFPQIRIEIELQVTTPRNSTSPVPTVLQLGFIRSPFGNNQTTPTGMGLSHEPSWKEQLIGKGWGFAIMVPSSVQPDSGSGLRSGIIGLANKGDFRTPEQWGTLRAWAWGASRAIDYLETDPDVDHHRIGVEGLSRYGKAALVAMAFEPRISIGFIGSSGAGGAKILRRNFGEQIENLVSSAEYHWFAGNFIRYGGPLNQDDLPVDAHHLVALCAPRPIFISVGSPLVEGNWIDAKGMFIAAQEASSVYRLLGKKGLDTIYFPPLGKALIQGEVAYRQHAGGHTTGPNWSTWIAWATQYWE